MLPGIGKVKVLRIVEYRKNQYFYEISDIKNIKGIGDKTFEKISAFITTQVDINCVSSKNFVKLYRLNNELIKELIFLKKKKVRISNSFLKKRFEKYNISEEDQSLFYISK